MAALAAAACGGGTPETAEARRARGIELINAVGQHVAAAQTFSFSSHEVGERVRRSGTKEPVTIDQTIQARRPDRLHMKASGGHDLEIVYDGKQITLLSYQDKVYGVIPGTGPLTELIPDVVERYDIPLPLGDFVGFTSADRVVNEDTTGGWVGEETLDGAVTDKVVWQHPNLDWTAWIGRENPPLLHRLDLVYKARRGSPQRSYTFSNWQFGGEQPDSVFAANVPEDFEGIPVIQRASAVLGDDDAGPVPDKEEKE